MMADVAGGGPQILEALLKTDSASSWNQDKLADFGKKTRKEARALVKGGGATGEEGEDDDPMDVMDADEVRNFILPFYCSLLPSLCVCFLLLLTFVLVYFDGYWCFFNGVSFFICFLYLSILLVSSCVPLLFCGKYVRFFSI